jgi:hypothetical protein
MTIFIFPSLYCVYVFNRLFDPAQRARSPFQLAFAKPDRRMAHRYVTIFVYILFFYN